MNDDLVFLGLLVLIAIIMPFAKDDTPSNYLEP